jgi:geranylgeranyl pyrophosphate synthase
VAAATEAAFKMVPLAARVLARAATQLDLTPAELGAIGMELFRGAGAAGMVGGQVLDLEAEGRAISVEELVKIHRMKTGALITASAVIGALAARAPTDKVAAIRMFGAELGLAFQIVDDILDATSTSQELGKTAGKDAQQQKATFTTILRNDEARAEAEACISRAVDHVDAAGLGSGLLHDIAAFIINRRS